MQFTSPSAVLRDESDVSARQVCRGTKTLASFDFAEVSVVVPDRLLDAIQAPADADVPLPTCRLNCDFQMSTEAMHSALGAGGTGPQYKPLSITSASGSDAGATALFDAAAQQSDKDYVAARLLSGFLERMPSA